MNEIENEINELFTEDMLREIVVEALVLKMPSMGLDG